MRSMLNPLISLKWGSIAFAVLWSGWMVWWSGDFAPVNIIILAVCGAVAGYFWYRLMTWQFRLMGMLPRDHSPDPSGK